MSPNLETLELIWKKSSAPPDFVQAMRQVFSDVETGSQGSNSGRLLALPALCCRAAGGQPEWAEELTAAWMVFFLAADMMDSVEDGDPLDYGPSSSPGLVVSTASGLFFTAALIMNQISARPELAERAGAIISEFYAGFLGMCGGQHLDLVTPRPTLSQYWQIASLKSGSFFSLATYLGARLAGGNPEKLPAFRTLGEELGILIQILDDLEDYGRVKTTRRWGEMFRTLQVAYALEALPARERGNLIKSLEKGQRSERAARQCRNLLEASGAADYIYAEFNRHRQIALTALDQIGAEAPIREAILALIPSLD